MPKEQQKAPPKEEKKEEKAEDRRKKEEQKAAKLGENPTSPESNLSTSKLSRIPILNFPLNILTTSTKFNFIINISYI